MSIRKIKRDIKYWFQRRIRGWSDDECWNVEYSFLQWLNSHLKVYLRDADTMVDLEYHTFKYKNKKYTQKQLINKMIELSDELLNKLYVNYNIHEIEIIDGKKDELLDIFKLTFWSLWW